MPRFRTLSAEEVVVGRARIAQELRAPYVAALRSAEAGRVELEKGERPEIVRRLLRDAAQTVGKRIRVAWESPERRSLVWKAYPPAARS